MFVPSLPQTTLHTASCPHHAPLPRAAIKKPSIAEGLIASIHSATGLNLTTAYLSAKASEAYSRANDTAEGFTRLTDNNLEEVVGYERFDESGAGGQLGALRREKERVWVFMM